MSRSRRGSHATRRTLPSVATHTANLVPHATMPRGEPAPCYDTTALVAWLFLVLLLIEAVARPIAPIAVVGHAFVSPAPIRMLPFVERAARPIAAIAVVGHALGVPPLGSDGRRRRNDQRNSSERCACKQ